MVRWDYMLMRRTTSPLWLESDRIGLERFADVQGVAFAVNEGLQARCSTKSPYVAGPRPTPIPSRVSKALRVYRRRFQRNTNSSGQRCRWRFLRPWNTPFAQVFRLENTRWTQWSMSCAGLPLTTFFSCVFAGGFS